MTVSKLLYSLGVLFIFAIVSLFLNSPSSTSSLPGLDVFVLAGQSNMAGRGDLSDVTSTSEEEHSPIFRLSAQLRWEEAQEPLHADIDFKKRCGVGPGLSFARAIQRDCSRIGSVGLVPCAVGGTKISQWVRGSFLYNQMVHRTIASVRLGGTLRAILWYQGESDTRTPEDAEAYQGNMERLISDLRHDLGDPTLPFIQVALASAEGPYMETVRRAQLAIRLPNVVCVDGEGLKLKSDHLHLTTSSAVQLGFNLARAFLDMQALA